MSDPLLSLWRGPIAAKRGSMVKIAAEVAAKHGMSLAELRGAGRRQRPARARQEAWARIRAETNRSYPAIGQYFGRDHTTVLAGVRRHEERQGMGAL